MSYLAESTKLEVLHDHYKETFAQIQGYCATRDRLFTGVVVMVTVMLFELYAPQQAADSISQFISEMLGLSSGIDVSFLGSVIWFGLLGLVVRYLQTTVHIERQYEYIHKLEACISPYYGDEVFTREGRSYLRSYRRFSAWAGLLYTRVFPFLLLIVVSWKMLKEVLVGPGVSAPLVANGMFFIGIWVSVILYLLTVHRSGGKSGSKCG